MQSSVEFEQFPQLSQQYLHCQLWTPSTAKMQKLGDGTEVAINTAGKVVQAQYANGCKLIRHYDYVLVSSAQTGNLFGSERGWFALD